MICANESCGVFFCDDLVPDSEVFNPGTRRYCTETCARSAAKSRSRARKRGELEPAPLLPGGSCPTGNVRYKQKEAAESAGRAWVQGLQGAGLHLSHKLRSYQCPECRGWHYDKSTAFVTPPIRPLATTQFGHRKKPKTSSAPTIIDGSVGPCPDCGKKRFPTKKAALDLRKQRPDAGFRAYQCGDFWHLTTRDAATIERYRSKGSRAGKRAS